MDHLFSGIEVTELVHRKTLERSIKALRERAAGKEPQQSEAYFAWQREDFLSAIGDQLAAKDKARLKGGPYDRYILVIHTDETFLDRTRVEQFLAGAAFTTAMVTDAIVGLSYDPSVQCCPTFRLHVNRAGV